MHLRCLSPKSTLHAALLTCTHTYAALAFTTLCCGVLCLTCVCDRFLRLAALSPSSSSDESSASRRRRFFLSLSLSLLERLCFLLRLLSFLLTLLRFLDLRLSLPDERLRCAHTTRHSTCEWPRHWLPKAEHQQKLQLQLS